MAGQNTQGSHGQVGAMGSSGRGINLRCHMWPSMCRCWGFRVFRGSACTAASAWGSLVQLFSSPFYSGMERKVSFPLVAGDRGHFKHHLFDPNSAFKRALCRQLSDHVASPSLLAQSQPYCWDVCHISNICWRGRADTTCRLFFQS